MTGAEDAEDDGDDDKTKEAVRHKGRTEVVDLDNSG